MDTSRPGSGEGEGDGRAPRDPFRLEPEAAPAPPAPAPPAPAPPTPGAPAPTGAPPPAARPKVLAGRRGEEREVSVETVRERHDPGSVSRPGALSDPAGYPLETLAYPFRGRGVLSLLAATAVFALADWLTAANAFLGAMTKVFLFAGVLQAQIRTVAATATGADAPTRFAQGSDFESDALRRLLGILVRLALYLLPAGFLWLRPYLATPENPVHDPATSLAIAALLSAVALLAPVLLLATAMHDPGMAWPWRAVVWCARGLGACVAVGAGWAAFALAEVVVARTGLTEAGKALGAYGALRMAVLWFALVGARCLGVLGRRYAL